MAVKEISSASQRIVTVPPFKAKESYRNLFKPPLAEAAKKELVDSKQAFLKLEMNRIFGNWMRNVSELNPHLQFEIYSKTGDVGAHALFYSAENLNDTCEQCKASLSQIDAIDGLSIENRYLH
ncbi:MAG: hypothetical protein NTV88_06050, partial [Candidatus Micrarchaeota archaeon]|nr:hypothetical protein [Candidatus Micrarchaeota archaeon]